MEDIDVSHEHHDDVSWFNKQILNLLHKDRLNDSECFVSISEYINRIVFAVLPTLFEDVNQRMSIWGAEGMINPFEDVYKVGICSFS